MLCVMTTFDSLGREELARQSLTALSHRQQSGKSFKQVRRTAKSATKGAETEKAASGESARSSEIFSRYLRIRGARMVHQGIELATKRKMWRIGIAIAFAGAALVAGGCAGGQVLPSYNVMPRIDAVQGKRVIEQFKCGSCHTIPGIRGANGVFGPPLMQFGRRSYIAGNFPNAPSTLMQWIMDPPAMKPKTAMPTLGLDEDQARDAAAYLETLQ
jgi:cytochrome c